MVVVGVACCCDLTNVFLEAAEAVEAVEVVAVEVKR